MKDVIVKVVHYKFIAKPLAAVTMMSTGIPPLHTSFWHCKSIEDLRLLYFGLTATSAKVLEIMASDPTDKNEERVFG